MHPDMSESDLAYWWAQAEAKARQERIWQKVQAEITRAHRPSASIALDGPETIWIHSLEELTR